MVVAPSKPVFIADSCIGGLSVVKSIWDSGVAGDAVFMADYAVNPLGVKSDADIANVVDRWLRSADGRSDTLVIACNTVSVRHHQLPRSDISHSELQHIVSMVDCFEAMVKAESDRLEDRRILVIGTEFTASQSVYPDILSASVPGISVDLIAATDLERKIARFEPWSSKGNSVLTSEIRQAIESTDFAVLACTCFPMVRSELEYQFPDVVFLDPGAYCSGLLHESSIAQQRNLQIEVTGSVVSTARVTEFANAYLADASSDSRRLCSAPVQRSTSTAADI